MASRTDLAAYRPPRLLLNLLLAGVLLRLLALGYWSLWLDEGVTWATATLGTWEETLFAEANHPPVWRSVTRLWIAAFGDSEAALRAPAALLGILGMGLAWVLGLRLLDPALVPRRGGFSRTPDGGRGRRAAVVFAALMAVAAYFLEYAQEARMYTALLVETLALTLLYLRWLDRGGRGTLVAYVVVAVLALHTHYFAVWPLASHAAHALWASHRSRRTAEAFGALPILVAIGVAGLAFVPWAVYAVTHFERIGASEPTPLTDLAGALWRMGAGPAILAPGVGRQATALTEGEKLVAVASAALWAVPLLLGLVVLLGRAWRGLGAMVVAGLVLPLALLFAVSFALPVVHPRYLVFLAPWVFLLPAIGVTTVPRWLGVPAGLGLLLLVAAGVAAYHGSSNELAADPPDASLEGDPLVRRYVTAADAPLASLTGRPPYGREPWRQVHDLFVRPNAEAGDLVVLHPGYLHLVWDYYGAREEDGGLDTLLLPREATDEASIRRACGDRLRGKRRVFLIQAAETSADPDDAYRAFRRVLTYEWITEGPAAISVVPPVLFQLSWGIRVAVFTRS